jgi:hypothetical protein
MPVHAQNAGKPSRQGRAFSTTRTERKPIRASAPMMHSAISRPARLMRHSTTVHSKVNAGPASIGVPTGVSGLKSKGIGGKGNGYLHRKCSMQSPGCYL